MKKNNIVLIIIVLMSGGILYSSNLFWLSQHDRPSIRGNHVGLAFLSAIVFLSLALLIRRVVLKKKKVN